MELFKEILIKILLEKEIIVSIPALEMEIGKVVGSRCFQALQTIKEIIEDDDVSDVECFIKIEKIMRVYEEMGSNGGSRHDFG